MLKVPVFLPCILCIAFISGQIIPFDLSKTGGHQYVSNIVSLDSLLTNITVTKIPADVGFFVVQVHSYRENVSLSDQTNFPENATVNGTNVGLVHFYEKAEANFYIGKNTENLSFALVAIVMYRITDPIPGGCNMVFNTEIAPYQRISHSEAMIMVESQAPSLAFMPCLEPNPVEIVMYHSYIHVDDFSSSSYFENILNMITVDAMKMHGRKVPSIEGYFKYRRFYNNYRGVGEVFGIVARYGNMSSAYVPIVSYGCDDNNWHEDCNPIASVVWQVFLPALIITGVFVNMFGHRFFKTNMFLMGLAVGATITYSSLIFQSGYLIEVWSLCIGCTYGLIWLFIWYRFGTPVLSVQLTNLLGAFIMMSVFTYVGLADLGLMHNNINFWLVFASGVVLICSLLTFFMATGHIIACCLIGSYACVAALNCYLGGNMHYIFINTIRRVYMDNYNLAVIDPPFQLIDLSLSILWIIFFICGFGQQWYDKRGKPPFPPTGSMEHVYVPTERTPLLSPLRGRR